MFETDLQNQQNSYTLADAGLDLANFVFSAALATSLSPEFNLTENTLPRLVPSGRVIDPSANNLAIAA